MTASAVRKPESGDAGLPLEFRGRQFVGLPSGALFWPAEAALLVADLHLEKMSSFAAAGQLLPPYDTGATLSRLAADLEATGARAVICLGDSFHRDEGPGTLMSADRDALGSLMRHRHWTWIAGNHDPAPHGLGGVCAAALEQAGLHLCHHPDPHVPGQIAGHLHPAARVHVNGRATRRRCFAWDGERMILPAYGVSTGSLNVLGPAFAGLFVMHEINVAMLGRDWVWPVARRHLVRG